MKNTEIIQFLLTKLTNDQLNQMYGVGLADEMEGERYDNYRLRPEAHLIGLIEEEMHDRLYHNSLDVHHDPEATELRFPNKDLAVDRTTADVPF